MKKLNKARWKQQARHFVSLYLLVKMLVDFHFILTFIPCYNFQQHSNGVLKTIFLVTTL